MDELDDFDYNDPSEEEEEEEEEEEDIYFGGDSLDISQPCAKLFPEFRYIILSPEKIQEKMFELVDEVNNVFQLSRPIVRVLLSHFRWDKEELMSRYYSGDQEALFKEAHVVCPQKPEPAHPKLTVQCGASATQVHDVYCDICCCSFDRKTMTGLDCGHLFCLECWNLYLQEVIRDEGKAETIYCPSSDCNIVVNEDTILRLLQDESVKKKYRYLITNSFVEANRSLTWCPRPGCVNAVFAADREERAVRCSCDGMFCFGCKRDPHEPLTCDLLSKWLKKCDDESETANWFHINTKECPKCHAPIEKNGGCNHITCRNSSCRAEFCWMCLGPWDRHGSSWYKCNRYDESDSKEARSAQQKSRAALERYLFYCNRYLTHCKSNKLEHKLYAMIREKRQELEKLAIPQVESHFLKAAVDTLSECRSTLMYTYAFAFYLKKNNQCMIFEVNQADMEMATEHLSGYLERDLADSKDEFQKLKVIVLDKTKYCNARKMVLLQHVYEGYAQGTWEFQE